eukprot:UN33001
MSYFPDLKWCLGKTSEPSEICQTMSKDEFNKRLDSIIDDGLSIEHKHAGGNWWTYRSSYIYPTEGSLFINVEVKPPNQNQTSGHNWSNTNTMLFGHTMYGWCTK